MQWVITKEVLKGLMLLMPGLLPVFSTYQLYQQIKDENLAASIGSTNETLNQYYSNDFDSLEAPTFLGCFKLPLPLAVGRLQTITCTAESRPARKPSERFLD